MDRYRLYPIMRFHDDETGVIPEVRLPSDHEVLIPLFMSREGRMGREGLEAEIDCMKKFFSEPDVKLKWDDKRGLMRIDIGTHGGFDLQYSEKSPYFAEHNLGGENSLVAYFIATNYVERLLFGESGY